MSRRPGARWIAIAAAALAGLAGLVLVVLWAILAVAVRTQNRTLLDAVRRFNRRWLNPAQLTVAGSPSWYASVVRHTGRRSGREYATPIWAEATPDGEGYLVPLPYGTGVDWLRNIQAGGHTSVTVRGHTATVTGSRVVSAATAEPMLPPREARRFRFYGMAEYVLLLTDGGQTDSGQTAEERASDDSEESSEHAAADSGRDATAATAGG